MQVQVKVSRREAHTDRQDLTKAYQRSGYLNFFAKSAGLTFTLIKEALNVVLDAIESNAMDSTVAKYLTRKEKFELTDSETLLEESDNGDTVSQRIR